MRRESPRDLVVVFVPEYVVAHWWQQALHNQQDETGEGPTRRGLPYQAYCAAQQQEAPPPSVFMTSSPTEEQRLAYVLGASDQLVIRVAGAVEFNEPGLMGREVFFFVSSHGYEFAPDGFATIVMDLHGKGGHAAMPHNSIDPVPAACQMVQAFQTIVTRNKRPIDAGVISVTMIHTGEATNVVPDSCEIQGTVRTFTLEVLDLIESRMKAVAEHTCAAFGTECEFEFVRNYPPTINHPAETEFARRFARFLQKRRRTGIHVPWKKLRADAPAAGAVKFFGK